MKVKLEKLQMEISPLTDEVFVGIVKKNNPNEWKYKVNLTNNFLHCVVQRWNGYKQEIVSDNGKKYLVQVKEIK